MEKKPWLLSTHVNITMLLMAIRTKGSEKPLIQVEEPEGLFFFFTKHQLKFKRKLLLLINITNGVLGFKQQPAFHI